jgi:hypothetical protein
MRLSDEDKRSILEESQDVRFQKDLKLLSLRSRNLTTKEYLDFLKSVSKIFAHPMSTPSPVHYHTVIF